MTTQGHRLKEIRLALNMTQQQFGEALGISKQFYSNIETGRTFLNNEKLVLLFTDFNVNLNYLLGAKGDKFNNQFDDDFTSKVKAILKNEGLIQ